MAAYTNKLTGETLFDPFEARRLNAETPGIIRRVEDDEPQASPKPLQLPLFQHFKPPPAPANPKAEQVLKRFLDVGGFSRALQPVNALKPLTPGYVEALTGGDDLQKANGFIFAQSKSIPVFNSACRRVSILCHELPSSAIYHVRSNEGRDACLYRICER